MIFRRPVEVVMEGTAQQRGVCAPIDKLKPSQTYFYVWDDQFLKGNLGVGSAAVGV